MKTKNTILKITIAILLIIILAVVFTLTQCSKAEDINNGYTPNEQTDVTKVKNSEDIEEVENAETIEDEYYTSSNNNASSDNDAVVTPPAETNPFSGKKISVMGDSISTYTGWSDARPITDESCTYRYGEAYYGPKGGDFHNTDMLVTDTWWHQAATELGAEILVSNAGNSTGLLIASYPASAAWDQYLKEMLAYKSRPYYMGTENEDPDIIALYIGSSDMGKARVSQFGSIKDIDFDTLITLQTDGTYSYAEPKTVAEAYSILLHKLKVTYPDAEIYCFNTVPNAGGTLKNINTKLQNTYPFNKMVKEVADHHDAILVDIYAAFAIDPDNDGVAVQEDVTKFKTYFHEDPHPNAAGFDVITECFVNAVRTNSKYN